jgi:hypothetical protein
MPLSDVPISWLEATGGMALSKSLVVMSKFVTVVPVSGLEDTHTEHEKHVLHHD